MSVNSSLCFTWGFLNHITALVRRRDEFLLYSYLICLGMKVVIAWALYTELLYLILMAEGARLSAFSSHLVQRGPGCSPRKSIGRGRSGTGGRERGWFPWGGQGRQKLRWWQKYRNLLCFCWPGTKRSSVLGTALTLCRARNWAERRAQHLNKWTVKHLN